MTDTATKTKHNLRVDDTLSFDETVRGRRSYRGFLPKSVPEALMTQVLEDAQRAPSNCNTQPWNVHIVSGSKLAELSQVLHEKDAAQEYTPDFSFDFAHYYGAYRDRQRAQGTAYYKGLGVAHDDAEERRRVAAYNYSFFNAPHVALLFMPSFGDNVRVAGDIGMYGQTLLLSLTARGLGGIPQTSLGFFAGTIREVLGITDELKMLFGISFGYPDESDQANSIIMDRVPLNESVIFHS